MKPLDRIHAEARARTRHIILPEGQDPRVAEAARIATAQGLARITLMDGPAIPGVTALAPAEAPDLPALADHWHRMRASRGMTAARALTEMRDPIRQAAMRVHLGQADGTVGGAVATTADTVRAALQIIGKAAGADAGNMGPAAAGAVAGQGGTVPAGCDPRPAQRGMADQPAAAASAHLPTPTRHSASHPTGYSAPGYPVPDYSTPDRPNPDRPHPRHPIPSHPASGQPTPDYPTPDRLNPDRPNPNLLNPDRPTPDQPALPIPGIVSSFFLMLACGPDTPVRGGMIFSDCGLVIQPDAAELAAIALSAAASCRQLLAETPRVALLSFSTAGSAEHPSLGRLREALALIRAAAPDLEVDGELQFDAALDDAIRARKAPQSPLTGRPNVFIFPDLAAGNIGYKIAQRLGGLTAIGPILQGLAKPANDLSRGCSAQDIVNAIAITAIQAK